jgi:hypothetical protein
MKHLLWLIPLALGLAAMYLPKLLSVALAAMLVCGVIWIGGLIFGAQGSSPARRADEDRTEQNRDPLGVQRDIPPPTG